MGLVDWFEAEFSSVPTTSGGVWTWVIAIMAVYVVLAIIPQISRKGRLSDKTAANVPGIVWNASTFAMSVMLLIGLADHPAVIQVIGDTTPFLVFVGFMGLIYGLVALSKGG